MEPVDIVLLSHDRLEYLAATVEAVHQRTPEPFRLTLVDNASGPDVRNWLAANRRLFHRLILRPTNELGAALQHGIDATTSDPYVVSDTDVVVPDVQPSWLARLLGLMQGHPDFGLIGLRVGPAPPSGTADPAIVEGNAGACFQMIRRDALREPYLKDSITCQAVRNAGYRVGSTREIRGEHLGGGDPRRYPMYVVSKNEIVSEHLRRDRLSPYPFYHRELESIQRPPTLAELAVAGPILARTRAAGLPDGSVLELTWTDPAVAAAVDGPVALERPDQGALPFDGGAAGAVTLIDPPADRVDELLGDAFRIAAKLVVVMSGLEAVQGRSAGSLAPEGWDGSEGATAAPLVRELARHGEELPAMRTHQRFSTSEHCEEWLSFFAAGAFGSTDERLFVFTRRSPLRIPKRVLHHERLPAWKPGPPFPPAPPPSLRRRLVNRLRSALAARIRRR